MSTMLSAFTPDQHGLHGLETILNMHSEIKKASLDSFEGNEFNMSKGYIRETLDENISIVTGTAAEHDRLLALGYTRQDPVVPDPLLPKKATKEYYYINTSTKLSKYAAGAISLSRASTKGSDLFKVDPNKTDTQLLSDLLSREALDKNKQILMANAIKTGGSKLKGINRGNIAQPAFDSNGNVTSYRYVRSTCSVRA